MFVELVHAALYICLFFMLTLADVFLVRGVKKNGKNNCITLPNLTPTGLHFFMTNYCISATKLAVMMVLLVLVYFLHMPRR